MDAKLIERVRRYAMGVEPPGRYEHSVRTAETARRMCCMYGLNPESGYFAGIAHDICKEMGERLLLSLSGRDGLPMSDLERDKPSLLHGRAAAAMLRSDFGVEDRDVLDAVRFHTFGMPGMCDLAKVLYAADKIEPGRGHVTKAYLERLFSMPLDELVLNVVRENIGYLDKRGKPVAPVARRFLAFLEEKANAC